MYRSILSTLLVAQLSLALPQNAPAATVQYGDTKHVLPESLASQWYDKYDAPSKKSAPADPNSVYSCSGPDMNSYKKKDEWISFNDMWKINEPIIKQSNAGADYGFFIRKAIEKVSQDSKVDARIILGVIMQESTGKVDVECTGEGKIHCGFMQISYGRQFDKDKPEESILHMVEDGVYGTTKPGILHYWSGNNVGWINPQYYSNLYAAVHVYNGGKIESKDLNTTEYGNLKSRVYANDLESRMMGWSGKNPGCSYSAGVGDASKFPDLEKCKAMMLRDTSLCRD